MISPSNAVVVVFPFVPVIASTSPFLQRYASSISPQIGRPASFNRRTSGRSTGTPGLNTTRSSSFSTSSGNTPTYNSGVLLSVKFSNTCALSSFSFPSNNTTSAPAFSNKFAAATPLIPVPNTSTFFSVNSIPTFLQIVFFSKLIFLYISLQSRYTRSDKELLSQLKILLRHGFQTILPVQNDDESVPYGKISCHLSF